MDMPRTAHGRRGSALLAILPIALLLGSLGAALLFMTVSDSNEAGQARRISQAELLAEACANRAIGSIESALAQGEEAPTTLGTEAAPLQWGAGSSWATIAEIEPDLYSVESFARSGLVTRQIQAVVEVMSSPIYDYSVFAGNSSGDPAYELRLSGSGAEADSILGNVYSAGDLLFDGDSFATGDINASGTITGAVGTEGVTEPIPDLSAMLYEVNHDYDVAALFAGASYQSDEAGGDADQVPETNPAHIFRRNPSDRSSLTSATPKDDYFLEDPWETPAFDPDQDGSDPYICTLTGDSGEDKVFFIDGNLWIDNRSSWSFQCQNESGNPVRVTFVVKGNIHFTDNLFYADKTSDAVAFIAMKDTAVPDTGNIYFGDPVTGTLEHMDAFMYAENNFEDNHLDADGSKDVTIFGNMTAGNQVLIERDFVKSDGSVMHSQLTVEFDDRIATGAISLPGLPTAASAGAPLTLRMWRHVGVSTP